MAKQKAFMAQTLLKKKKFERRTEKNKNCGNLKKVRSSSTKNIIVILKLNIKIGQIYERRG